MSIQGAFAPPRQDPFLLFKVTHELHKLTTYLSFPSILRIGRPILFILTFGVPATAGMHSAENRIGQSVCHLALLPSTVGDMASDCDAKQTVEQKLLFVVAHAL